MPVFYVFESNYEDICSLCITFISLEISLRATARGFESHPLRHVAADVISFAATFLQKSPLTHFVAAPLQIEPACAGLQFGFGCGSVGRCVFSGNKTRKSLETRRFQGIFCVIKEKCPQNTLKCRCGACAKKFVVPKWCPAPKNDPRDAMWG